MTLQLHVLNFLFSGGRNVLLFQETEIYCWFIWFLCIMLHFLGQKWVWPTFIVQNHLWGWCLVRKKLRQIRSWLLLPQACGRSQILQKGNSTPQWLDFHSAANCSEHAIVMNTPPPPNPTITSPHTWTHVCDAGWGTEHRRGNEPKRHRGSLLLKPLRSEKKGMKEEE